MTASNRWFENFTGIAIFRYDGINISFKFNNGLFTKFPSSIFPDTAVVDILLLTHEMVGLYLWKAHWQISFSIAGFRER
jgi:hypothetical protein